jgi:DNA-binding transcriptional ArsR family regulator
MAPDKTSLLSDRLAAAMSHPTRLYALTVFWDREASPREIAAELEEPINNVTYHVKQLVDLGWIEMVAQRPARGGRVVEHFYKAIMDPLFDDAELANLDRKQMHILDSTTIKLMSKDVSEAIATGTFFAHQDNHLTRIPLVVDAEGWEETKEILDRALDELLQVKEAVARRAVATGPKDTISTKVEIIHFESPRPKRPSEDGGAE